MITFKPSEFSTSSDKTDFLGNGSYASVRRCYHHELGSVVVKCFALTGSEGAMTVSASNIQREAKVLLRLNHENIIKFHGVTNWSSCCGLVLEEATGHNLEDLFIHKPEIEDISWHLRQRIFHDISAGLDYLHHHNKSRSYIHGDLKLQNILLTNDLKAKIADFGAVTIAMASGTFSASIDIEPSKQKTVLYSPPELLNNPSMKKTCAMDVYSFGLIGYEIITRQRISHGREALNNLHFITQMIKEQGAKPDEEIMGETKQCLKSEKEVEVFCLLEKLVKKCWLTNPDDRPIISEVKRELENSTLKEVIESEHLKKTAGNTCTQTTPLYKYGPPFQSILPETDQLRSSNKESISRFERTKNTKKSGKQSIVVSSIEPSIKTEKFNNILQKIAEKKTEILHCSGVLGSGTSQIVRELGKRFPFAPEDNELSVSAVKKQIRCKEQGHDVKEELKNLVDVLLKGNKKSSYMYIKYQEIIADIDVGVTDKLVEVLLQANVPVLIIVEDPVSDKTNKNNKLLQDLLRNLNKKANLNEKRFPKHLYISSRYETVILEKQESDNMEIYIKETVTGFTKEEALEYLKIDGRLEEKDKSAAEELYERFNGLPLGLQVAKGFCKENTYSYKDYLSEVKSTRTVSKIGRQEKENITNEFGDSAEYMFQAIVMPFIPGPDFGNTDLDWKILACLSYFNFYKIPRYVIEFLSYVLCGENVTSSRTTWKTVGKLIGKLIRHDLCIKTEENFFTFHEAVNYAFRLIQLSNDNKSFNPLEKAIEVMSGLVSKDMRMKDHSEKMYNMRKHLQTMLDHVEKNENYLFQNKENCFMLKVLTSQLYESTGAIMLNESSSLFLEESDRYFRKALKLVSEDVYNQIEKFDDLELDLNEEAEKIVAKSKEIGQELPEKFTMEYVSKLFLDFDPEEKIFLQSKCRDMGHETIKEFLDGQTKRINFLEELQKRQLFLTHDKYAPVFYAERIASILHCHSRWVLYADLNFITESGKWKKMSKLSNLIANKCSVSLLTERLSQMGGFIPIVLKTEKDNKEENQKVINLSEDFLNENETTDMYENGIIKEVYGPSKTSNRISFLKFLTRINARQLKCYDSQSELEKADKYCQELLDLSQKNAQVMSKGSMSIIYCAKYYAARNNCEKSMSCFEEFFKTIKDEEFNKRFNVSSWAVYNYTRAVISFNSQTHSHIEKAMNKCKQVLNSNEVMTKDLNEKLKSNLEKLEEIVRLN